MFHIDLRNATYNLAVDMSVRCSTTVGLLLKLCNIRHMKIFTLTIITSLYHFQIVENFCLLFFQGKKKDNHHTDI